MRIGRAMIKVHGWNRPRWGRLRRRVQFLIYA